MRSQSDALEHIRKLCVLAHAPADQASTFVASILAAVETGLALPAPEPELTPAQLAADKLLDAVFEYEKLLSSDYEGTSLGDESLPPLRALLEPLRRPAPPTLEEALDALRGLMAVQGTATGCPQAPAMLEDTRARFKAAGDLLARVPK